MEEGVQCAQNLPCTAVQLLTQRVGVLEEVVDKLANNLPPWVTIVGSVAAFTLGGIIGVLSTLLSVVN